MTPPSLTPTEEVFPPPPDSPGGEAQLVREALAGSEPACAQLVQRHGRRIFDYAFHLTRQRQDAEDVAQQTFIKAFHHLSRFDAERPLINWLLTIARRTALNQFRSARQWVAMPEEAACDRPSPAHQAEEQDGADRIWARAHQLLPQREFEILWLRYGEDLSTEETAAVVDLTCSHVKVLLYRARQALLKGELSS